MAVEDRGRRQGELARAGLCLPQPPLHVRIRQAFCSNRRGLAPGSVPVVRLPRLTTQPNEIYIISPFLASCPKQVALSQWPGLGAAGDRFLNAAIPQTIFRKSWSYRRGMFRVE